MSSLSLYSQVTMAKPKFRELRHVNKPIQPFSLKVSGRAFLITKKSFRPWKCFSPKPTFEARYVPTNAYFQLIPIAAWAAKTLRHHLREQKVGYCTNSLTLHETRTHWLLCPSQGCPKFFEPSGVNQPLCRSQVVLDSALRSKSYLATNSKKRKMFWDLEWNKK